jgi:hypothetical protein
LREGGGWPGDRCTALPLNSARSAYIFRSPNRAQRVSLFPPHCGASLPTLGSQGRPLACCSWCGGLLSPSGPPRERVCVVSSAMGGPVPSLPHHLATWLAILSNRSLAAGEVKQVGLCFFSLLRSLHAYVLAKRNISLHAKAARSKPANPRGPQTGNHHPLLSLGRRVMKRTTSKWLTQQKAQPLIKAMPNEANKIKLADSNEGTAPDQGGITAAPSPPGTCATTTPSGCRNRHVHLACTHLT